MRISLDTNSQIDIPKTGIGNYVNDLIKTIVNLNQINYFQLFGIYPLKAKCYLDEDILLHKNISTKFIRIPSKLFHQVFSIWQKIGYPPIELLTGPIDIFHSFDWYCPSSKKAKIVATIFDVIPLIHPEWHTVGNTKQHINRLNSIKKNADKIITISEASKKDINKYLNIDLNKISVAYPGCDTEKFKIIRDKNKINKILDKYNLEPGYFLYVGTLQTRKNIPRLIQAFKIWQLKSNQNTKLVLIGKKGIGSDKIKFGKNIIHLGYVENKDLPYLYNGAKVFIYPSLYEGFGMPILEAMASGCPVITSNISSMPEAIGNAGLKVNPYNIEEIAEAFYKLTSNSNMYNKFKALGFIRAKKFTWEKCAKETMEIYKQTTKQ